MLKMTYLNRHKGGNMSGKVKHVARVIYYGFGAVLGITLCICAFLVYFVVSVDPETGIRTDGLGRTLHMPLGSEFWLLPDSLQPVKESAGIVWNVIDWVILFTISGGYFYVGKKLGLIPWEEQETTPASEESLPDD